MRIRRQELLVFHYHTGTDSVPLETYVVRLSLPVSEQTHNPYGRPMSVTANVPASNSEQARRYAESRYPGYSTAAINRAR